MLDCFDCLFDCLFFAVCDCCLVLLIFGFACLGRLVSVLCFDLLVDVCCLCFNVVCFVTGFSCTGVFGFGVVGLFCGLLCFCVLI